MVKSTSLFTWTDGEVELLLKVTNEYKVSKMAEGDWESVQRKYSDILDRFREEIDNSRGSGKDFPYKGEEISKQSLTNKLKSIRLKYTQAVDTGKWSGHGRVVFLYYEHCEGIWGGPPAMQQLAPGLESTDIGTVSENGDDRRETTSTSNPSPAPLDASTTSDASSKKGDVSNDESATEAESASVTQRRNLLDSKLNNYKQEKLKRKLPKEPVARVCKRRH